MQQLFSRNAGLDPRNSISTLTVMCAILQHWFWGNCISFWDPFHKKVDVYCLFYSTDELTTIFARQRPPFPNKLSIIKKHRGIRTAKYSSAKSSWLEFWFCFTLLKFSYTAPAMASQAAENSKKFLQMPCLIFLGITAVSTTKAPYILSLYLQNWL